MSVLNTTNMFNNQLNSFTSGHINSRSYNELSSKLKANIKNNNLSQPLQQYAENDVHYIKKRSYSDLLRESSAFGDRGGIKGQDTKRSRTAPPSPPSQPYDTNFQANGVPQFKFKSIKTNSNVRSRSLSPNKKFVTCLSPSNSPSLPNTPHSSPSKKPTLPSISTVLQSTPMTPKAPLRLKPITPTVSLDYFDTYKPNDENWRYGLLDTINKDPNQFNLNQYDYLNKHKISNTSSVPSPAFVKDRPSFNSRISSKIIQNSSPRVNTFDKSNYPPCIQEKVYSERKINFPYESNYTYLNKTYLNDVKKYPEYLELAHSLIQLSQPQSNTPDSHCQPMTPVNTSNNNSVNETIIEPIYQQNVSHSVYPPTSTPPSSTRLPNPQYNSFLGIISEGPTTPPVENDNKTKFIPVTPPSSKCKSRSELLKSSPRQQHQHAPRVCVSCGSDQSPCWRPSWSIKKGQLCNSCGLRYKKTSARCLNDECKKIPAKGEWSLMQSKGKSVFEDGLEGYCCLDCGWRVEVKK